MTTISCADCGKEEVEGGASLKTCKSCMDVKYCDADCQRNHWPKHKKECKQRAAELRDEVLFKDPPAKEDCPICFLPMPLKLICCMSLPPATLLSVPIYDFAIANEGVADTSSDTYFTCCGKSICGGCFHSFAASGKNKKCPYCKSDFLGRVDGSDRTNKIRLEEVMKRVEASDAGAISVLGSYYYQGQLGLLQDCMKALELWKQAATLGSSQAHFNLGNIYNEGGEMTKAKFHFEAAAMAGNEMARFNLGVMEMKSRNVERGCHHYIIAASTGDCHAMHHLRRCYKIGYVSRESIDSTLTAYNNSCSEMRSVARDAYIRWYIERNNA